MSSRPYKEISLQPQIDYVNTTLHIEKITIFFSK